MKLTMTMIVRDEQERIVRCLDSFWDQVDEVVLVDTGSTDRTVAAAEQFARRRGESGKLVVGRFDWCDDFAAARQHADDLATGDWVSWVDADDEVVGLDRLKALAEQADDETVAFFCRYQYATDDHGNCVCELWRERMVRHPGPAWEGRLHEHKIFKAGKVVQVDPQVAEWRHHHDAKETDRSGRNVRILTAWLEDEPDSPRILSSLALEHVGNDDPENAVQVLERYLAQPGEPPDRRCQNTRYLCAMLMKQGRVQEAEQHAYRALQELWSWTDTHLTLAEVAQAKGEPDVGYQHAATALQMGKPQSLLILNPLQYTAHARSIMAVCLAQMGRYEDALTEARQVLEVAPGFHLVAPYMAGWQTLLKVERTVATFTAMAQQLVEHSEILKAKALLDTVPFFCTDDPRVIQARVQVDQEAASVKPAERPEVFANFLEREATGDYQVTLDGAVTEAEVAEAIANGGRLYVCAPDGVNQHRDLRAYRSIDLAHLLQKHGRFTHFAPTDDGHVIAGITPVKRRGEVAIWTGWAIGPWHPKDILDRGLGGSETAAWRLAEELAAMDYTVTLYGQFEESGLVGDVMLRDFRVFDPTKHLDVFVGFRDAHRFDTPINADVSIMWLEDVPGNERMNRQNAANIDHVACVSYWHQNAFRERYPWFPAEKVHACRNGVTLEFFDGPAPEREKRVLFTSSPDRGLDVVLECWPQILARVPDAELLSTYSRWYDIVAEHFPGAFDHRQQITRLLNQPGVRRLEGGMGQRDLAHLMRASLVWVHPSWSGTLEPPQPFNETSCISAMEAQAAGLVVVAAEQGALVNTVQVGELIPDPSNARDESWRRQFVDHVVRALTDEAVQAHAQEAGPQAVRDCGWRGAAEQLVSLFPRVRSRRSPVKVAA